MKTKYDIHDTVLIPATVRSLSISNVGTILYNLTIPSGDINYSNCDMIVAEKQIHSAKPIEDMGEVT